MSVFNQIIDDTVDPRLQTVSTRDADERQLSTFKAIQRKIPGLVADENHCLQTHIIDLQYFVSIETFINDIYVMVEVSNLDNKYILAITS